MKLCNYCSYYIFVHYKRISICTRCGEQHLPPPIKELFSAVLCNMISKGEWYGDSRI